MYLFFRTQNQSGEDKEINLKGVGLQGSLDYKICPYLGNTIWTYVMKQYVIKLMFSGGIISVFLCFFVYLKQGSS